MVGAGAIVPKRPREFPAPLVATWILAVCIGIPVDARAVPSFARQTGMPCQACHTAFPELTPFGREFKLEGYTLSNEESRLPPVAIELQGAPGFTQTNTDQPEGALPSRFKNNDNFSINQVSLFWAGRLLGPYANVFGEPAANILNKVGVFAQGTWDGVARTWAWDQMEARAAEVTTVAGKNLVVGGYLNNNPTLQDLWNTTPAWGFPYSTSNLAPAPAAAPLIAGGLAQQVVGFGGYGMLANLLYADVGAYHTISRDAQRALGVDPSGETDIDNLAPYWRIALQKRWGPHFAEIGTYGLAARTLPNHNPDAGHDRFRDLGADLEYQWLSDPHEVTLMANWIQEGQSLPASQQLGLAENQWNRLWTVALTGSYLFDKTYGANVQYFQTNGSADAALYSSRTESPASNGWIFQLNYLPFNKRGGPAFWRFSNVKLSLQYTFYQTFDGSHQNFDGMGRNAGENNTLYIEAWIDF